MDLTFILLFIEQLPLQFDFFAGGHQVLGSDDPIVSANPYDPLDPTNGTRQMVVQFYGINGTQSFTITSLVVGFGIVSS